MKLMHIPCRPIFYSPMQYLHICFSLATQATFAVSILMELSQLGQYTLVDIHVDLILTIGMVL